MTYWILPWNKDVYNLPQCLQDFGFVEWRQRNKLSVGDIVFLYCSSPHRQILYMMKVSKINIPFNDTINDEYLFNYSYHLKETDFYARFEPIAEAALGNSELSYNRLQELGIKSQLQGGIKVPDSILTHILENFDVVFDDLAQTYTEGKSHNHSIISYERNQQARQACINKYGYSCQICGLNLEQKYGPVGREFIHVHHINFISSEGGLSHTVDPLKDLIPVCPNCHAILHRKLDGKYLSVQDVKELVNDGNPA